MKSRLQKDADSVRNNDIFKLYLVVLVQTMLWKCQYFELSLYIVQKVRNYYYTSCPTNVEYTGCQRKRLMGRAKSKLPTALPLPN